MKPGNTLGLLSALVMAAAASAGLTSASRAASLTIQPEELASKDTFLYSYLSFWNFDTLGGGFGSGWTLTSATDITGTGWVTGFGAYDAGGAGPLEACNTVLRLHPPQAAIPEPGTRHRGSGAAAAGGGDVGRTAAAVTAAV